MTDVKIDHLANIAGQSLVTPIRDIDIEAAKARYDVNFWGNAARHAGVSRLSSQQLKGPPVNGCLRKV